MPDLDKMQFVEQLRNTPLGGYVTVRQIAFIVFLLLQLQANVHAFVIVEDRTDTTQRSTFCQY